MKFGAPKHLIVFDARQLYKPMRQANSMSRKALEKECRLLLASMQEQPSSQPDDEAVVLASLWSIVMAKPRGPWNAETLASNLGVSRTSLYRMVKRQHGTSPARVVERLRMEEACRLLSETRHPIDVIASQVGYASASSFSIAFKRLMDKTPSRFRQDAAEDKGKS